MKKEDVKDIAASLVSPKTFRGYGIDENDQLDFIKYVVEGKKDKDSFRPSHKQMEKLHGEILEKGLGYESLQHLTETKFNRLDKMFRKFGINIDSEYLLTGSKSLTVKDLLENDGQLLKDSAHKQDAIMRTYTKEHNKTTNDVKFKAETKRLTPEDILEELRKKVKQDKRFENLVVDETIRYTIDENGSKEFFQTKELYSFIDKQIKNLKDTLPGNILFKGFDD